MLVACSTNAPQTQFKVVKPNLLLCPQIAVCQIPNVEIKTNADLARSLDQALTQIELCQLQITAFTDCVKQYNEQYQ
ncbi:Rz1-like lysis system protein LysC [Haemophilus sputorum]|uniref:Rz1-like lysis system protein LysC n=1 Tax=Haemophilus sputorum TaxID=1078480 RepID=UPI003C7793A3